MCLHHNKETFTLKKDESFKRFDLDEEEDSDLDQEENHDLEDEH